MQRSRTRSEDGVSQIHVHIKNMAKKQIQRVNNKIDSKVSGN